MCSLRRACPLQLLIFMLIMCGIQCSETHPLHITCSSYSSSVDGGVVSSPRLRRSHSHRLPMSPQYALNEFGHKLSTYEQKEVMEYPEVWFLGLDSKKVESVSGAAQNSGVYFEGRVKFLLESIVKACTSNGLFSVWWGFVP